MQVHEFTEKLGKKFNKGGVNDVDVEDMEAYLIERSINQDQMELLYANIAQLYKWKSFPSLAFVKSICDDMAKQGALDSKCDFADHGTDDGAGMGVEDIITRCRSIRAIQRELTGAEIDFIHAWDGLVYISEHLEKTWPGESHRIEAYLKTIKDQIMRRETVHYSSLPGMKIYVADKPRMERGDEPRRFENPFGGDAA